MTYTFKLSRRLASIPAWALLAATVVACQDAAAPEESFAPVHSAEAYRSGDLLKPQILPDSATTLIGQPVRFRTVARSWRGDTIEVPVRWTATGGTITSKGYYVSNTPGAYLVIARSRWTGRSDTATVRVVATQPRVVRLLVTPDTVTLATGGQKVFTATSKLSDSSTAAVAVTWTATGGTIDSTGSYKAGTTTGKHWVIATSSNRVADSAQVTISSVTPTAPPPAPVLERVILTPATASLVTGETRKFAAYGRTSAGDSVAVAVTYTAGGGSVTAAGLYTAGTTAGTYRVIARQSGGTLADTSAVTIAAPPAPAPEPTTRVGYYVTPAGSSTGSGTASSPWSLGYALQGASGRIQPGDTVWVRGGTYRGEFTSRLAGSLGKPIHVRQYPGERAIIDGPLFLYGSDTWYWGTEVTTSATSGSQRDGITAVGPRLKIINCYVHDVRGNGLGLWSEASDLEVAGCVLVHNGLKGSGNHVPDVAHGVYAQNSTGTKVIRDLILLQTQGYGLHFYTEGSYLRNMTVTGSIIAGNGVQDGCNVMIGGGVPVQGLVFSDNAIYEGSSGNGCLWLGRNGPANGPATVRNNVILGGDPAVRMFSWGGGGTFDNNTIVAGRGILLERSGSSMTFSNNRWYGSGSFAKPSTSDSYTAGSPSGSTVMVRPSAYQPGRAHIAVFNWSRASSVTASVPGLGAWELRRPESLYGAPVAKGSGSLVTLPLGGAVFGAFVVVPVGN